MVIVMNIPFLVRCIFSFFSFTVLPVGMETGGLHW
jgi:hypothetical protein